MRMTFKQLTFKDWLKEFKEVDRPIGDLAKDVLNDPDFPETNKHKEIYDYLECVKWADYQVLSVFENCWKAYKMLI
jgi:uncharacterized protein YozE (UPF0346 family)